VINQGVVYTDFSKRRKKKESKKTPAVVEVECPLSINDNMSSKAMLSNRDIVQYTLRKETVEYLAKV
jgi:hypothetical protein